MMRAAIGWLLTIAAFAQQSQTPPVVMGRGRLPPPDPRVFLAEFVAKMTPAQREHAKLYESYNRGGNLFGDLVNGPLSVSTTDTLGMWSSGEPPTESLVDVLKTRKCRTDDAIFDGVVTGAVSNPTLSGNYIFTDYMIQVTDWISSRNAPRPLPATVIVTRPGGGLRLPNGMVMSADAAAWEPLPLQSRHIFLVRAVPATGAFRSAGIYDEYAVVKGFARPYGLDVKDDIPEAGLPLKSLFLTIRNIAC